ncbi:MAG: hypothetical protein A3G75_05005 [Verrucomicrobia bacterium RIFCSPLOWO2_12_FULL_64_8]|nr:MAG: hypothetical protein A3G75_05005 [Verrucomicrobia bacterium RIFCSPLOWO2_12_FULL_64_8]
MLHVAIREQLLCPIYALMPDHLHIVWLGVSSISDQRKATAFLRRYLEPKLAPCEFQHQAHDHVLRGRERGRNAFASICAYIAENPVRTGLAPEACAWPFTSCIVPGYPALQPTEAGFWDKFWRIYGATIEHGGPGRLAIEKSRSEVE